MDKLLKLANEFERKTAGTVISESQWVNMREELVTKVLSHSKQLEQSINDLYRTLPVSPYVERELGWLKGSVGRMVGNVEQNMELLMQENYGNQDTARGLIGHENPPNAPYKK